MDRYVKRTTVLLDEGIGRGGGVVVVVFCLVVSEDRVEVGGVGGLGLRGSVRCK